MGSSAFPKHLAELGQHKVRNFASFITRIFMNKIMIFDFVKRRYLQTHGLDLREIEHSTGETVDNLSVVDRSTGGT